MPQGTDDSGFFWFFDPAVVELVVKVVNGHGINGKYWVFFGSLSDVEYTVTVTDTVTGQTKRYHNPLHVFASTGDINAFPAPASASPEDPNGADTFELLPWEMLEERQNLLEGVGEVSGRTFSSITATATNSLDTYAGESLANSAWPMFRHDLRHTGQSPYTGAATAIERWEFLAGSPVHSSPAIGADGTIYVGSDDGKLYAVNPNGSKRWEFLTTGSGVSSSPAIGADGTIYVGSLDGELYAVNPNGSKRWEFLTGGRVYSSPAIGLDGTIYVGSWDRKLYAVNPDGSKKWEFFAGSEVDSSPAIGVDGTIYVGSFGGKLYAVNPNGSKKWKSPHRVSCASSSPAIGADGTVYVGSSDGKLYAVNPNGSKRWEFLTGGYVNSSPAIDAGGTVYVGSWDDKLYAVNPNGSKRWEFLTGDRVDSSPAIGADGTIYVGSHGGQLYAVNPNGSKKWEFLTGAQVSSSPAIGADGTIFFGSEDSNLYAIGSAAPPGGPSVLLNNDRFRVSVTWRDFQGNTGAGTAIKFDLGHRLLLVFQQRQHRARDQGARRARDQREVLGLLRCAVERRVRHRDHGHGDGVDEALGQSDGRFRKRRRHQRLLSSGGLHRLMPKCQASRLYRCLAGELQVRPGPGLSLDSWTKSLQQSEIKNGGTEEWPD